MKGSPPPATILGAGLLSLAAMLALVLLSPLLAGFSPTLYLQRDEITFLDHLSQGLAAVPAFAEAIRLAARGAGPLADPDLRMVAVLGPVLLATAAMLALLRWVERQPAEALHAGQLRLVLGVGLALGVVASCAVPSYTVDFWLSVAWGRMFAVGQNAYYLPFTHVAFQGIPGGGFEETERFTYGPLWALLSHGLAVLAGDRTAAAFVLGKLVLLLAWAVTVGALTRAAGRRGVRAALRTACLTAWLPPLLLFGLAEGHNDMFMLMFVALWLEAADRRDHRWTPLWLVLACLTKLVAAPLLGLELLLAARTGALRRPGYWGAGAVAALLVALCLGRYYDGPGFMAATAAMQRWIFWVPTTFVTTVTGLAGHALPERTVDLAVAVVGLAGVAVLLGRDLRAPTAAGWLASAAAIIGFTLATLTGHVWPWFALWLVPVVALAWPTPWSAVALAFLLLTPVLDLAWVLRPDWSLRPWFDLPLYGAPLALTLVLLVRRDALRPLPEDPS
ncbi:MAG: hypothetical protein IPI38_10570 [Gemmatimonadetes bacterium]|nr:hypothetical protein [Gemmatimonadota bacterium]